MKLPRYFALLFSLVAATASQAEPARPISYNRDVKPILSNRCFYCHGFDEKHREADLRLDDAESAHRSGVFMPGNSAKSELIARIMSDDPEKQMPPAVSKKTLLSPDEVAIIKRWIDEGAKYDAHWSFVPPTKSAVPKVSDAAWPAGDIDRFVAAVHAEQGFKPSPDADRRTLLRRLSFDLTGLPPSAEEMKAWESDKSPEAYEKEIDRLLASKHYGERMAAYWLDVVRFADTAGYHSDNPRNIAPYRDYVINAFNANLPFDQFAREQLAGDLLPQPTLSQKVASGYNRLLQTTEEGGAQAKEYTAKYAADRVRNFGSAWMALTTGCCECHNHKFDPLTAKDFYSLAAFFADVQESAVGRREPGMSAPTAEQEQELARLTALVASAEADLKKGAEDAAAKMTDASAVAAYDMKWQPVRYDAAEVKGESKLQPRDGNILQSVGNVAAMESYVLTLSLDLPQVTALRLEALSDETLPAKGPGTAPNGNFVLTRIQISQIAKDDKELPLKITKTVADHSQDQFNIQSAIDNKTKAGWAVLPKIGESHEAIFELEKKAELKDGARLRVTLDFRSPHAQHNIGRFRITATDQERAVDRFTPPAIHKIVAVAASARTPEQTAQLVAYVRERSAELQPLRDRLQQAVAERTKLDEAIPKTLVSISGPPRTLRILKRGNWLDDSGEIVQPAVPAMLGTLTITDRRPTRLDLADWLVDRKHPLTARVFVNRVWKLMFGRGLVRSAEDFGSQGDYPSHPELLDHLAVDFMENGWNVKRLIKQIAMSRTYRQSSLASPELREKDPANVWLARQGRYRLEAEMVRDNALAVSGLLVRKIGGTSAKPYQPRGYWSYLNFPTREWENDKGEGLYRRGIYTFWQRTFPHPSLIAFDAPSREECTVDRARSNTPLQALVLLNDPTYVEAARHLAAETIAASPETSARMETVFRRVLQRSPREEEAKALTALYEKHRSQYQSDPKTAEELLKVGDAPAPSGMSAAELAAWTSVARIVLNLHETITRN